MKITRDDFPIFSQKSDKPFVYFDSAATTQKPRAVLSIMNHCYTHYNASVHRGLYGIAERITQSYEEVRYKVARLINAQSTTEIVFTQGTTDSINTVVQIWARHAITAGDEIVITMAEHHSNFVPWQQLARERGAILKIIPVLSNGMLDYVKLSEIITDRTKVVAATHVSNALGIRTDLSRIIAQAKKVKAKVVVDGAQAIGFEHVDVQALGCDFYAFSGHKMYGPTGIGILYINRAIQKECVPYKTGGGMVHEVTIEQTTYAAAPSCFEAGTPPVAQVIGLGAAIDYVLRESLDDIRAYVTGLTAHCINGLQELPGVTVLGPIKELATSSHIVSFTVAGMHAHDVAAALDKAGICVRAGHHCAQPLAVALGYSTSIRVSFQVYNTLQEVDYFLKALNEIVAK